VTSATPPLYPVFVKQLGTPWGGRGKGNHLDTWPADLRTRDYPAVTP
jgi:hypothetical protein